MNPTKFSRVTTAARNYAAWGGANPPSFPAGRAWRIVPQLAASYDVAGQAVAAGVCRPLPPGTKDGAFPVWVRLTEPGSRAPKADLVMVDNHGWNLIPTGHGWRIEVVAAVPDGLAGDRFVYVVEVMDDETAVHPIATTPTNNISATVQDANSQAPIAGSSFAVVSGALDANAATVAGGTLRLTAVNGDVFYAVDADSTNPANRALLMAGATEYVRAGATIHYSDGPTVGATLYVAQLPP